MVDSAWMSEEAKTCTIMVSSIYAEEVNINPDKDSRNDFQLIDALKSGTYTENPVSKCYPLCVFKVQEMNKIYTEGIMVNIGESLTTGHYGRVKELVRQDFKMVGTKILVLLTVLMAVLHLEEVHGKKMSMEEIKVAVAGLRKYCIKETGAQKSLVVKTQEGEFPPDPALQCYLKCVLESMKGIRKDALQEELLLRQSDLMINDDIAPPIKAGISKCAKEATSSDICELAWQFAKCYYAYDPELYFFP
ncbi:hypothetical protein KM043_018463 [Ampulex compressa]|nr:hypothetical protein KM043_018463 [Ampulex compressa]